MPHFTNIERSAAIGARLCLARVTAGLSRAVVADALDMSWQQFEKYERGMSRLPAIMLADLGRLLNRPPLFFIETDHAAVARAALLQLPTHGAQRRQFDRAINTLKQVDRAGPPPRSPADERLAP